MSTKIRVRFHGGPEDPVQVLRDVVKQDNTEFAYSAFAKWRAAGKGTDIWTLEFDAVPTQRSRVVFILTPIGVSNEEVAESILDLQLSNTLPLVLMHDSRVELTKFEAQRRSAVEVADQVFVLNLVEIDDETQNIISFAEKIGRQIIYLQYM